jgi:protein-tyrosine phosphatase
VIDLHHHCLPGVDDGPPTLAEAVAQCRAAAADGIRTVVATPHRFHPQFDVPPDAARAAHAALTAALAAEGVDLEILLGHEVHWHGDAPAALKDGGALRLGGNARWFLLELPASHCPPYLDRIVFDLHLAGQYPVLAHPERNAELAADAERVRALRRQGVRVQVTASALTGEFGRRAQKASEAWLAEGLVDFLATDAHGPERRPPRLRAAVERAARAIGREAAERLVVDNPRRVLRGEALA